jgi:hypothetical protein
MAPACRVLINHLWEVFAGFDNLGGVVLCAGITEARVRHFPASQLPGAPAARFAALFAAQPRWTREELDPYLAGLRVSFLQALYASLLICMAGLHGPCNTPASILGMAQLPLVPASYRKSLNHVAACSCMRPLHRRYLARLLRCCC